MRETKICTVKIIKIAMLTTVDFITAIKTVAITVTNCTHFNTAADNALEESNWASWGKCGQQRYCARSMQGG